MPLGLVAGKRTIQDGGAYGGYFRPSEGKETELSQKGSNFNTIDHMMMIVSKTLPQTRALAQKLKGATLNDTLRNIFNFLYQHYQYEQDSRTQEELRTPYRAWQDRKTGIDCDCYSITISSILTNLGITHAYKMTKYDNKSFFQHIYVVVPKDQRPRADHQVRAELLSREKYHVIDPVLDTYDYEKPPSAAYHQVISMNTTKALNGLTALAGSDLSADRQDTAAEQLLGIGSADQGGEQLGIVPLVAAGLLARRRIKTRGKRRARRRLRKQARALSRSSRRTSRSARRKARRGARRARRSLRRSIRSQRKAIRRLPRSQRSSARRALRASSRRERKLIRRTRRSNIRSARTLRKSGRKDARLVRKGRISAAVAKRRAASRRATSPSASTASRSLRAQRLAIARQQRKNRALALQLTRLKRQNSAQQRTITSNRRLIARNTRELNAILAAKREAELQTKASEREVKTYAPKRAKVVPLAIQQNIKLKRA